MNFRWTFILCLYVQILCLKIEIFHQRKTWRKQVVYVIDSHWQKLYCFTLYCFGFQWAMDESVTKTYALFWCSCFRSRNWFQIVKNKIFVVIVLDPDIALLFLKFVSGKKHVWTSNEHLKLTLFRIKFNGAQIIFLFYLLPNVHWSLNYPFNWT